jgi:hypothetical protein
LPRVTTHVTPQESVTCPSVMRKALDGGREVVLPYLTQRRHVVRARSMHQADVRSKQQRAAMDPTRFDDFTKVLATATSRRQALKAIAATTMGGMLGLSGIGKVFATAPAHTRHFRFARCERLKRCHRGPLLDERARLAL